ncbi:hypothetical protein [Paenibacillus sp. BAC0078]
MRKVITLVKLTEQQKKNLDEIHLQKIDVEAKSLSLTWMDILGKAPVMKYFMPRRSISRKFLRPSSRERILPFEWNNENMT